jgi:hypothetical protein
MDKKIPFYQIQPFVYNVCIYLKFEYGNIKVDFYLEGGDTSA